MVDTLGLPTLFFTHSAADLQLPELARLICPDDLLSRTKLSKRTQLSLSSSMPSMLDNLVPVTTGSALSGIIVAAFMFTASPGLEMHLVWNKI